MYALKVFNMTVIYIDIFRETRLTGEVPKWAVIVN